MQRLIRTRASVDQPRIRRESHEIFGLRPAWRCSFDLNIRGVPYIRTWGLYRGRLDFPQCRKFGISSGHQYRFWQEVNPAAAKLPGKRIRVIADLAVDNTLKPICYDIRVGGVDLYISFSGTKGCATFPDGHEQRFLADADFVLAGNMPPQLDLWLRKLLSTNALPYHGAFFSPEALQAVPYWITKSKTGFASSLCEKFRCDRDGNLLEIRLPQPEYRIRRVDRPIPKWRSTIGILTRPQYLGPPKSVDVKLKNITIAGPEVPIGATLAMPRSRRPFGAALFLSGSGSHDRHGITQTLDLGYHRLLDSLAAKGLLSLRFDTRGTGTTPLGPDPLNVGFEDIIADAEAALEALERTPTIRKLPLLLIGHSQGGLTALDIAVRRPDVAGVVLLAVAGRAIDEILSEQISKRAQDLRLSAETREQLLAENAEFFHFVRRVPNWREGTVPGNVLIQKRLRRFFSEQLKRDPCKLAARLHRPVLIVQGTADAQVSVRDAELLRMAAERGGTPVTYRLIKRRDHLFKVPSRSGRFDAYMDRRRTPSGEVVNTIIAWARSLAQSLRIRTFDRDESRVK